MITELVAITGNTYPVKDSLKAIGARWNPDRKCWMISADKAEQASRIVRGLISKSSTQPASYRPCRCQSCGVAASRWNPIYRSGVCKDCFVSEKEEREMGY